MAGNIHKTKGIVLRTVKYGETSLIVSIFTEQFGVQSYIINGVRTSGKKGAGAANLYQPAALLDLVVYYNEHKHLHRIKEAKWHLLYQHLLTDVHKNAVTVFMIELLTKCLKEPEENTALFHFVEDALLELDKSETAVMSNMPLFFSLQLAHFFGFKIDDNYSQSRPYLDLQEGSFVATQPSHPYFMEAEAAAITSQFLKVMQTNELATIRLNHLFRRRLLQGYETFYRLHIDEFSNLKTLPVLREILS
ncbi:MAG TPA: DNA repair protein RecO [Chitinophagaceae bacterium]|nr:DNA repair protein RecO [Chitinophagaceae bacterium]